MGIIKAVPLDSSPPIALDLFWRPLTAAPSLHLRVVSSIAPHLFGCASGPPLGMRNAVHFALAQTPHGPLIYLPTCRARVPGEVRWGTQTRNDAAAEHLPTLKQAS